MALKNIILYILAIIFILIIIVFVINSRINDKNSIDDIYQVEIIIKDNRFYPATIRIPSGKKTYLIVTNQDNTPEEFESIELHRERIIMPNETVKIILAPLTPGTYNFFGEFHQETAQGSIIVYQD